LHATTFTPFHIFLDAGDLVLVSSVTCVLLQIETHLVNALKCE